MRNVAVALAVLQTAAWLALAQSNQETLPAGPLVVRPRGGQTTFHIGEVIPLELSFTSPAEKKYQLDMATYDRSGRLMEESFTVGPRSGWVDPLDLYFRARGGFIGGGLRGMQVLSAEPVVVYDELNEWVRFEKPGEYRVTVSSARASTLERPFRGSETRAVSNQLRLTIIAAQPEWKEQTLQQALAVMNGPASTRSPRPGEPDSHRDAIKALRYLGTAAAAREMAHRVQDLDCRLGLAGSPARDAGLDEMKRLLRDPNVAIDGGFLDILSVLALPDGPGQRWKDRQELENGFRQELISLLALKRGAALATSTKTALESSGELPAELKQSLTKVLIANFDNLTAQEQADVIQRRLKGLDRETLLPLLRKVAQRYQDFPQLREMNAWNFNQASGAALKQWYAAAPEEARPAVLREILRPNPRFGADVLGMLPDQELPEEAHVLVAHLRTAVVQDAIVNLASLIDRYAGVSVEPEVIAYLDPYLGKGACAIQEPLLAWLLKVGPERARPRLEAVLAARKNTGCFRSMLVQVGNLQDSPILQEMALKALNDPDSQVVSNAAAYLGNHGTAAAEDALWARFTAWHERWAGHEAELRYIPGGSTDVQWESGAGQNMLLALGSGQGWLASEDQLRRLIALAVGTTQRQQAEQLLKTWQTTPWTIQFTGMGHFLIAQYQAMSLDLAKAKLLQFPEGSEFRLALVGQDGEAEAVNQLSGFAREHGLAIRRER